MRARRRSLARAALRCAHAASPARTSCAKREGLPPIGALGRSKFFDQQIDCARRRAGGSSRAMLGEAKPTTGMDQIAISTRLIGRFSLSSSNDIASLGDIDQLVEGPEFQIAR